MYGLYLYDKTGTQLASVQLPDLPRRLGWDPVNDLPYCAYTDGTVTPYSLDCLPQNDVALAVTSFDDFAENLAGDRVYMLNGTTVACASRDLSTTYYTTGLYLEFYAAFLNRYPVSMGYSAHEINMFPQSIAVDNNDRLRISVVSQCYAKQFSKTYGEYRYDLFILNTNGTLFTASWIFHVVELAFNPDSTVLASSRLAGAYTGGKVYYEGQQFEASTTPPHPIFDWNRFPVAYSGYPSGSVQPGHAPDMVGTTPTVWYYSFRPTWAHPWYVARNDDPTADFSVPGIVHDIHVRLTDNLIAMVIEPGAGQPIPPEPGQSSAGVIRHDTLSTYYDRKAKVLHTAYVKNSTVYYAYMGHSDATWQGTTALGIGRQPGITGTPAGLVVVYETNAGPVAKRNSMNNGVWV